MAALPLDCARIEDLLLRLTAVMEKEEIDNSDLGSMASGDAGGVNQQETWASPDQTRSARISKA
jgi:hypothetical protein